MHRNISLYSQYFSFGAGSNVHTIYFFLSSKIKKAQYKIKNIYM